MGYVGNDLVECHTRAMSSRCGATRPVGIDRVKTFSIYKSERYHKRTQISIVLVASSVDEANDVSDHIIVIRGGCEVDHFRIERVRHAGGAYLVDFLSRMQ